MTCSDNEKIIVEKSKRSSYQSLINSVSCIKPFDNFDFVCRVLFSHVFLLLVVEQGPPFSVTFCSGRLGPGSDLKIARFDELEI